MQDAALSGPPVTVATVGTWVELAAQLLRQQASYLNDINFFPVADADTGTNVYLTWHDASASMAGVAADTAAVYLTEFAHRLALAARGNSGAILSECMRGLAHRWPAQRAVTGADLARCLREANTLAQASVLQPEPFTILHVTRRVADQSATCVGAGFLDSYAASHAAAVAATLETAEHREHGAVDAGALAWMLIWDSLGQAVGVRRQALPKWPTVYYGAARTAEQSVGDVADHHQLNEAEVAHADSAETEVFLTFRADQSQLDQLRTLAGQLGNSVVVVQAQSSHRLHVHTANPDWFLAQAERIVEVIDVQRHQVHLTGAACPDDHDHDDLHQQSAKG